MKVRVKPPKIIDREAKRAGIYEPLREHLERVIGADTLTAAHTILEFGSGRNGFIEYYTGEHQTGLALDLVDNTGCYDQRIKCLVSDGRTIPLDDASVDLIVSHSVVEHVGDLPHSLGEMNRVLRPGGHVYITVSPLYYSPFGSHRKDWRAWEVLDPDSPHYLTQYPLGRGENIGSYLNKLTTSQFEAMTEALPWKRMDWTLRRISADIARPVFFETCGVSEVDLVTREFRYVARKS